MMILRCKTQTKAIKHKVISTDAYRRNRNDTDIQMELKLNITSNHPCKNINGLACLMLAVNSRSTGYEITAVKRQSSRTKE